LGALNSRRTAFPDEVGRVSCGGAYLFVCLFGLGGAGFGHRAKCLRGVGYWGAGGLRSCGMGGRSHGVTLNPLDLGRFNWGLPEAMP
jgi:hypothetical protein